MAQPIKKRPRGGNNSGGLSPGQMAAKVSLLRAQGWTVEDIAKDLQRSTRNIYQILEKSKRLGTGSIYAVPGFRGYGKLSPEAKARIAFTADGFEGFFNAYSGKILSPLHKLWVQQAIESDRLLVNCPPRHAKSTIFSVWFPIWLIAGAHACLMSPQDPDDFGLRNVQILLISQTDKLAKKFTNEISYHLTSNIKLIADYGRFRPEMGDWPWRPNSGELMVESRTRESESGDLTIQVRGSGQQILGMEANWVIIDDAVSREIATHEVQREQLSEWFHGDVMTRLEPQGRAVVIGQRLHIHDLYGELAAEKNSFADGTNQWRHINYKAVLDWDAQIVLWPEKWTWKDIAKVRQDIGEDLFESMYQQNALASSRRLARNEWLYGDPEHPGCVDHDRIQGRGLREYGDERVVRVVSLDPSPTRFAGLLVADVVKDGDQFNATLIEVIRERMSVRDMISHLERVWDSYKPDYFIFEQVAAQRWLLQDRGVQDLARKMQVIPHNTGKNKGDPVYGVESLAVDFEFGRIRGPYGDAESKAMSEMLFEEAKTYPQGKTDDLLMALWFIKWNYIRLVPRIHDGETRRGRPIPPRLAGGWRWWQQTHSPVQKAPEGSSFRGLERAEEWRQVPKT